MPTTTLKINRPDDELYIIKIDGSDKKIVLDMMDVDLPYKANKTYADINKAYDVCKGNIQAIQNKYKGSGNKGAKRGLMSDEEREISAEYKKMYEKCSGYCDQLLGEGVMDAIFHKHYYVTMFDDLFTQLEPIIEEMQKNLPAVKERIQKKYGSTNAAEETGTVLKAG